MEMLDKIWDITLRKGEEDAKIKIRVIDEKDKKRNIIDKVEAIITKEGKIIIQ